MNHINSTIILSCVFLLSACQTQPEQAIVYDHNSWKNLLPATCVKFFDGCNNCTRHPGSDIAACTRKFCAHYEKPVCMDGQ